MFSTCKPERKFSQKDAKQDLFFPCMCGVLCTKTNLTNIFLCKTLSRNEILAAKFSEICETTLCFSRYCQCLTWNSCIQSREMFSNVHHSTSFDGLISCTLVLKRLARIHYLFHTMLPYQQHVSSVSGTYHQISSGKYALRTIQQTNSNTVVGPDKMPLLAGSGPRAVVW